MLNFSCIKNNPFFINTFMRGLSVTSTDMSKSSQLNSRGFDCERCENNRFFSLKRKSILYLLITSLYILFVASYLINEKNALMEQFYTYQQAEQSREVLIATSHSLRIINTNLLKGFLNNQPVDLMKAMHGEFADLQDNYQRLQPLFPEHAKHFKDLVQLLAHVVITSSHAAKDTLKQVLIDNQTQIESLLKENRQKTQLLLDKYHDSVHSVAINSSILGLLGIVLFGGFLVQFFKRMTNDIAHLHHRVKKIMNGYRKQDLDIQRNDELELLACGINEMALTLQQHEEQLELQRRKQYSQQKQGAIEHLAAGLVHEMGNPVAAITGLTEALQSQESSTDEQQQAIDQIELYTKRMNSIIEGLSKLAIHLESDYQLIDINHLIKSSVELWNLDERSYGTTTKLNLANQLSAINGIEEQLNQVLSNIIINAYEALLDSAQKEKQIHISSYQQSEGVCIEINDNGCGMQLEEIERALNTFYSKKTDSPEAGLGLPLCQSIIHAHQGKLTINSVPGQGTSVKIILPVVD